MNRRSFLHAFASLALSSGLLSRLRRLLSPAEAAAYDGTVTRLAFGSCLYQTEPQPVWQAVLRAEPQVFTFLGDNIYADTDDMAKMKKDYEIRTAYGRK